MSKHHHHSHSHPQHKQRVHLVAISIGKNEPILKDNMQNFVLDINNIPVPPGKRLRLNFTYSALVKNLRVQTTAGDSTGTFISGVVDLNDPTSIDDSDLTKATGYLNGDGTVTTGKRISFLADAEDDSGAAQTVDVGYEVGAADGEISAHVEVGELEDIPPAAPRTLGAGRPATRSAGFGRK